MNCDDFLSAVETGDDIERNATLQHAAICPSCAADLAVLQEIKTTLAAHEPLPSSARAVWENASRAPQSISRQQPQWAAFSVVAATIAVCLVFVMFTQTPNSPEIAVSKIGEGNTVATNTSAEPTVIIPDISAELTELSHAAESLDSLLDAMDDQVDRMEIQREIQVTLSRFDRW